MERYLRSTGRDDVADAANAVKQHLTADPEVYENPEQYFDQVIEINLDTLSPHLNGPFTPDLATPIAEMSKTAKENDWPLQVEWGLIGSCTNSSYEDLSRAASIAKQAVDKGLITKAEFGINPGSEQVRYTAERDGLLRVFEDLDAKFSPMPVVHALANGHVKGHKSKKRIQLFTRLTETSLNELMEIQIPMHSLLLKRWWLRLPSQDV